MTETAPRPCALRTRRPRRGCRVNAFTTTPATTWARSNTRPANVEAGDIVEFEALTLAVLRFPRVDALFCRLVLRTLSDFEGGFDLEHVRIIPDLFGESG